MITVARDGHKAEMFRIAASLFVDDQAKMCSQGKMVILWNE